MSEVILAQASDIDALSELIAEAFHDLAPAHWLIADDTARRRIFPPYFQIYLEHGLTHGFVYTTPDRAGVALWLPVGTEPPAPPECYAERLAAVTAPWTSQFVAFDAALESRHPVGRAHHHLALLAVRPDRQGQGIGSALLREHHRMLEQGGPPTYLEASSQRNRQLYLWHGYEDLGPPICLPDGPSLYPMWRDPCHSMTIGSSNLSSYAGFSRS